MAAVETLVVEVQSAMTGASVGTAVITNLSWTVLSESERTIVELQFMLSSKKNWRLKESTTWTCSQTDRWLRSLETLSAARPRPPNESGPVLASILKSSSINATHLWLAPLLHFKSKKKEVKFVVLCHEIEITRQISCKATVKIFFIKPDYSCQILFSVILV